jgi:mRNA interferase MazF
MNERVRTVIVVPMTSRPKHYPFRIPLRFRDMHGELLTDHIRSIDRSRLVRRLGRLDEPTSEELASRLVDIFQL